MSNQRDKIIEKAEAPSYVSGGSATDRKFWWACPECGEINASPADKRPENIVGCRCGWEGQWKKAKSPTDKLMRGGENQ